jgi:hypothetical protein
MYTYLGTILDADLFAHMGGRFFAQNLRFFSSASIQVFKLNWGRFYKCFFAIAAIFIGC